MEKRNSLLFTKTINKMKIGVIGFLFLVLPALAFGQARTTTQDGPWNDPATWGGLSVPDNTFGAITVIHNVTVTAPVTIDQTTVLAAGSLTVDPLITLTINAGTGVDLTVAGTLTINGSVINSGAAVITYSGASLVNNGILNIGTNNLTWSGGGTLSGTGATTVGDVNVTGASFTYTASGNLTINDDILGVGTFDSSGGGLVVFAGAGSAIAGSTPKVFNSISVTGVMTPAANISYTVNGNITVSGTLNDGSGTSATTFNGTTIISGVGTKDFFDAVITAGSSVTYSANIAFNGNTFVGDGDITTDSPTSLATISFVSIAISGTGIKDFTNVTIGAGTTTPNVNYTIRGNLIVTGTLAAGNGTTIFAGTTSRTGAGACTFNNVDIEPSATFSSVLGHTVAGNMENDGSFNIGAGNLTWSGSGTLSGTGSTTVADVNVTGVSFTYTSSGDLTLNDDILGTGTFDSSAGGTVVFAGATSAISGSTPKIFNELSVTGVMTPAANISYTISGDLTVSGTLNDGSGTSSTTFNGATVISGVGTKDFFDVIITGGSSVIYSTNIAFNGNTFVGDGSITTDSPTSPAIITFTTIAFSGLGTKDFTNVTIATGASTTPNADYTIRGNLVVTGTLAAGSGLTTFAGTTVISGAGSSTFNDIVVNSGASVSGVSFGTVNGNFDNMGDVDFTSGTLTLGAASVTTLSAVPLAITTFNALTTLAGAVIIDAPATNLTIRANFVGGADYNSLGTTTFNGTVTMSGAGAKTFNDLVVNGVSMTPNAAYTVNGNLSGTGALLAGNNTATFGGTTLISGSGAKSFNNVTVNNGSAVTYNKDISITGTTLLVNATGSLSTDVTSSPAIISFTSAAITGTGVKDFTNVTIAAGASTASGNFTVRGNLVMTGTLVTSGIPTFAGATDISGAGALTFTNNVIVNASSSLTASVGTITFGGTSVITNNGTMNVNSITISSASTMTAPSSVLGIAGVFTVTGGGTPATFNNGGGTIRFNTANGSNRLAGTGTKTFFNLDVTGIFNNTQSFTVNNNLSNSGTINCTAGTVTWGANGALSGTGTPSTTFFNLTIAAGQTLNINTFTAADITISSDLTLDGNLNHTTTNRIIIGDDQLGTTGNLTSAGTIQFNGANSQFTVGGLKTFTNLSVGGTGVLSVGAASSFSIDGILDVAGTLNAGTGISITTFGNGGAGTTPSITGAGTINFDDVTIAPGHTLSTTSNVNLTGTYTNNGSFVANTSTVQFNGAGAQSINGVSTTFNNLTLSGTGTKTFNVSTVIADVLRINTNAIAGLSNANTHTANTLSFDGVLQAAGTWGSTVSSPPATNQNNTFFSGTGLVTVAFGSNTFYSRADGDWNVNTTWSNTGFIGPAATGTPIAGSLVNIGNTRTVTVTANESCSTLSMAVGSLLIATQTVTVSGDVTGTGASSTIQFTGAGTLQLGGSFFSPSNGTFTAFAGSTVEYNGTVQTVEAHAYQNLTLSGTGSKTFNATTAIADVLRINTNAIADLSNANTHTANTLSFDGVLQAAGTWGSTVSSPPATNQNNTFFSGTGLVTVAFGSNTFYSRVDGDWNVNTTWSNTGFSGPAATGTPIAGSLVNIGDTRTVTVTANESCSTLSLAVGSLLIATQTVTVSGDVTGTGASSTIQFTGAGTLQLGGSFFSPSNGTFTAFAGSTVEYNGTVQTVEAHGYQNLTLSGTGSKTFNASTTIADVLRINTNAIADLSNANTYTANTLSFDGILQASGTWGSTSSSPLATNQNDTFFSGTGLVAVNAFFSRADGDWNVNTTWSNTGFAGPAAAGTPGLGDAVIIGNSRTVTVTANESCGPLSLNSGSLVMTTHMLTLNGNFDNNGTFTAGTGTIIFSGSAATKSIQGSSPTAFFNLIIGEGAANPDVQVEQTTNLIGEMTFDDDAIFDADGTGNNQIFTLISTVSGDARIGPLGGNADVTGNVTVQRYMDAEGKIYRYISSPVANPTAQDLQGEIPITGPFTGSSFTAPDVNCPSCAPCTGCVLNNTSMYRYEETIVALLNNRYTPFPSVGGVNTEPMLPGRGYAVYVRNDLTPTTWNLRAPINTGVVDLNVTLTSGNDGFNLVGNPYPSPIDWEGPWLRVGINSTIYTWDNSINNYASYTLGGASTNGGSRYVAHGQAFWVLASSGAADLRAVEGIKADRASIAQATFFRTTLPVDNLRIKLTATGSSDEVLIKLNEKGASSDFDVNRDALEFPSDTLLSLHAWTEDKKRLAVNTLGAQTENSTEIKLGLAGVKPGSFNIDFVEFENFSEPTNVYLLDRFTNTLVEILPTNKIHPFIITSDPASAGDDRFVVYLNRNGEKQGVKQSENQDFADNISVFPNPTENKITVRVKSPESVSVGLYNTLGIQIIQNVELVKSGDESSGQLDLTALEPGLYIFQIRSGGNSFNQRILKK